MIKKGYSLLEMLICLTVISCLLLISLRNVHSLDLEHYSFLNEYLIKQSEAILYKNNVDVSGNIYFNSMGHVNMARTVDKGKHKVIIHLGNGYVTYD